MCHDDECGGTCEYPGCKQECCYASVSCGGPKDVHKCSKHNKLMFEPERRATVTISCTRPHKHRTVTIVLTGVSDTDDLMKAAEKLIQTGV